ncbi:SDR family oxidoreductase, partial [Acinetobacter baumannii]
MPSDWDGRDETVTPETYGALKAICEQVVREAYADQALIFRPGLVVGPNDVTDRFTYWVRSAAT